MKIDSRAEELAKLVLDYSIELKKEDKLLIDFNPEFKQYAYLIGGLARERGAEIRYDNEWFSPKTRRELIQRYNKQEWNEFLEKRKDFVGWCNARVYIDCESNTRYTYRVKDKLIEFNREVIGEGRKAYKRLNKDGGYEIKWNIVGFPYKKAAESAGMSLEEYSDFVYSATIGNDWVKMGEEMKRVKPIFDGAEDVHIIVPNLTDIHLSLNGRGGKASNGKTNMPSGEIYYGPVENSINGEIYFQIPREEREFGIIEGVWLKFENGVIKDYSAEKNLEGLKDLQ